MHETLILRVGVADLLLQILKLRFLHKLNSLAFHIVIDRDVALRGRNALG